MTRRLRLDPDIVSRRGLISEIMTTPYLLQSKNKDGWSITAIKYDNKIFLSRSFPQENTWSTAEEGKLLSYTGYKFEQYMTKSELKRFVLIFGSFGIILNDPM